MLDEILNALRSWQRDGQTVQLHPGDVGWASRAGKIDCSLRAWGRGGRLLAIGLVDGPGVLRVGIDPAAGEDDELADQVVADMDDVDVVEVRAGAALRARLVGMGWQDDEPWSPLSRDLAEKVPPSGLRVEVVEAASVDVRVRMQRAAFERSTFTVEKWTAMARGPAYVDACCLVGYADDVPVAAATVWSAGAGRPGLLEPVGVDRAHRGRGYGRAMTLACAESLRKLGSSTATVCTRTSNVAAVATYASAGFRRLPEARDLRRPART